LKADLYQVVLHRPVEITAFTRHLTVTALPKTVK